MKKSLQLMTGFILLTVLTLSAGLCAFAAAPTADGVYTVPVTLYHAEKDKESMGNKYIVQTALITVKDGKKSITVAADGVEGLTFSYYTNGSVEGGTAEAKKETNVEINGKIYAEGFTFPLVTDHLYVGVKFKAPIMPVSPSARLKIDYNRIKTLSVDETEPEQTEPTPESTEPTTAFETTVPSGNTTKQIASEEAAAPTETSSAEHTTQAAQTIEQPTEATNEITEGEEQNDKSSPAPIIIVVALITAVIVIVVVVKKKK